MLTSDNLKSLRYFMSYFFNLDIMSSRGALREGDVDVNEADVDESIICKEEVDVFYSI